MRIASLLASATEIVCALRLQDHLVAISHECDYPPDALRHPRISRPRFDPDALLGGGIDAAVRDTMRSYGSPYAIDEVNLKAAAPDVILAQAVCEVCAVPTTLAAEAAAALGGDARVLSVDAHSIEDIFGCVQRLGDELGVSDRADSLVAGLRSRVEAVQRAVSGKARPTVMALEWLDPPFVPGHWVPEMIERAGGWSVVGQALKPSRQVAWADLAHVDPDILVIMPCGFDLSRTRAAATAHGEQLRAVAARAVAAHRAWIVDGSAYFNRSGPRVVDGVEILGALLHPDCFPKAGLAGRAEVWSAVSSKQ